MLGCQKGLPERGRADWGGEKKRKKERKKKTSLGFSCFIRKTGIKSPILFLFQGLREGFMG